MSKEFIDLSGITKRDYSGLYLSQNPFPTSLIPNEIPPFTADRKNEKKHFEDMMSELIFNHKSSVTVFVGDYGSGKTHILRALKHVVETQLLNFDNGVIPIYARTPGRNILEFYREFIEDVGRNNLRLFAERIMKIYFEENKQAIKKFVYKKEIMQDIDKKINEDLETFVNSCMTKDLFRDVATKLFKNLSNYDVLNAFLYMTHPSLSAYAWKWFLGLKLSKDELGYIDVKDNIGDTRIAYSTLKNFIAILNSINIKHVVLLIDELEKIVTLPSNLRVNYQDDLRHLIDDFPSNMLMIFSISPYYWGRLVDEGTALIRRLSDNQFRLDNFSLDDVKELINKYLSFSRTENFPNDEVIEKCQSQLYPFMNEAIEEIFVITKGKSSDVLKACRKSIEHLIQNNQRAVTKKIIEELFE